MAVTQDSGHVRGLRSRLGRRVRPLPAIVSRIPLAVDACEHPGRTGVHVDVQRLTTRDADSRCWTTRSIRVDRNSTQVSDAYHEDPRCGDSACRMTVLAMIGDLRARGSRTSVTSFGSRAGVAERAIGLVAASRATPGGDSPVSPPVGSGPGRCGADLPATRSPPSDRPTHVHRSVGP